MSIWARLGGTLGSGLGEGISAGLDEVARRRTKELARKQFIKDFTSTGDFTPEEAALLLTFPENQRFEAAQFLAARNNQYQQPQQQPTFQDLVENERGLNEQRGLQNPDLRGLFSPQMTQRALQPSPVEAVQSQSAPNIKINPKAQKELEDATAHMERAVAIQEKPAKKTVRQAFAEGGLGGQKISESAKKDITKKIEVAEELLQIADEMEKLHASGKVLSGRKGSWQKRLGSSIWEPNDETNTFDSLGSQAAILEASLIPGVTTNEKLKAAERTKPNITQTAKTQLSRIQAMRKKAQTILKKYGSLASENIQQEATLEPGQLPPAEMAQGKKFRRGNKTVKSVNVDGNWVWRLQ